MRCWRLASMSTRQYRAISASEGAIPVVLRTCCAAIDQKLSPAVTVYDVSVYDVSGGGSGRRSARGQPARGQRE